MIKKDIVNLINLNKIVLGNKKYEDIVLPDYKELSSEFEILAKEIEAGKKILQEARKMINSYNNCNHSVRLQYSCFCRSDSECVLCGKHILGDCHVSGSTIYNDTNRNRYVAMFRGNFFDDDEVYCDDGYDKIDVYDILFKVLEEKDDEEEIDFVQEIKKLNIDKCKVDERRKEKIHYILIIGGSSKYNLGNNQYVTSTRIPISTELAYLLSGIPGVRVEVFDNEETFNSKYFNDTFDTSKSQNTRFVCYESISDLIDKITSEKEVPFDIIIDASSLYEYNFDNKMITSKKIDVDFKEIFPNSYIIKIDSYSDKTQQELLDFFKEKLVHYNEVYKYIERRKNFFGVIDEDDFYTLNNGGIGTADTQDVYKNIRKVLIRR